MSNKISLRLSDVQGLTQLLTDATLGLTDVVEAMHHRIVHPPLLPSTPVQNAVSKVAGIGYDSTRSIAQLVGNGISKSLGKLKSKSRKSTVNLGREKLLSVVNGVVGDYLEKTNNPLAIPMQFRQGGQPLNLNTESYNNTFPKVTGKILLLIHGCCMNDLQWKNDGHDHGIALAEKLGMTPVYLHYNSGRHISTNGKELSTKLETLIDNWSEPLESLHIMAHSMGGLVSRSAMHYGDLENAKWLNHLQKVFFLGTPHHGAPMEKAGNYLDFILATTPYVKPLARLGKIRSGGVTDLRYGNLLDEDWAGQDRFALQQDRRKHVPLPTGIDCYNIAATKSKIASGWKNKLVGDGMVQVYSALGKHKNPTKKIGFPDAHNFVLEERSHVDLVKQKEVMEQILKWM